jgi:hypothetical protein
MCRQLSAHFPLRYPDAMTMFGTDSEELAHDECGLIKK